MRSLIYEFHTDTHMYFVVAHCKKVRTLTDISYTKLVLHKHCIDYSSLHEYLKLTEHPKNLYTRFSLLLAAPLWQDNYINGTWWNPDMYILPTNLHWHVNIVSVSKSTMHPLKDKQNKILCMCHGLVWLFKTGTVIFHLIFRLTPCISLWFIMIIDGDIWFNLIIITTYGAPFTNMDTWLQPLSIIWWALIPPQISTVAPLKIGYGWVISSHIFWDCNHLSMLRLESTHVSKSGHRKTHTHFSIGCKMVNIFPNLFAQTTQHVMLLI